MSQKPRNVSKSDSEWREQLTEEQFQVTRRAGTERALTGKYWNHKASGAYTCVCCGETLFASQNKFDSGCGRPSFDQHTGDAPVEEHRDLSFGMIRTEVVCGNCGARGHFAADCPKPAPCLRCGRLGHWAKDCPQPRTDYPRPAPPPSQPENPETRGFNLSRPRSRPIATNVASATTRHRS